MADPQPLVESLRRRIRAFLDDGDRLSLFDPGAEAEAAELAAFCTSHADAVPVEVVETLARLHWTRWQAMPDLADRRDLDIARAMFGEIRETFPELVPSEFRDPDRTRWPHQGARVLADLASDVGADPAHLDTAIEMIEQGLDSLPADDADRGVHLRNLASGHMLRFDRAGAPADLDAAVQAALGALRTGRFAHVGADAFREVLELAVARRYERHRRLDDLDKIVDVTRARWQTVAPDDPALLQRAARLAEALKNRFERTARPSDLDEAIAIERAALDASPPAASEERADMQSDLGYLLAARYGVTGSDADLAEAVTCCRAGVEMMPDRPMGLIFLAAVLRIRFLVVGDPADLEESVRRARAAGATVGPGDPLYGTRQAVLSQSLRYRYEHGGRLADLDEAVSVGRVALDNLPDEDSERLLCAVSLLGALRSRAIHRGELADLDEAVEIGRAGLAALPAGHPFRSICLTNLALSLQDRFEAVRDRSDIDEAVDVARTAVDLLSPHAPERQAHYTSLARILRRRYLDTRRPEDLDAALDAARAAVAMAGSDDPTRLHALGELSTALAQRSLDTGSEDDLAEAARYAHLTVAACPPGNPNRAGYLYLLGRVLQAQEQVEDAVDRWRDAVENRSGPPRNRISAARAWGAAAAGEEQWASAWAGYAAAVELIPLQTWRGLNRASQEHMLADWAGLGPDAAACAVHAGPPGEAAQVLEMGRGVLWGQLLETRAALTETLRERAPELAERLDTVRMDLDRPL